VSKPGPIVVTVRWQGSPLLVSLIKPGGATVDRQGTGSVALDYTATAEDVRKGTLWSVRLRSPQEAANPPAAASLIQDKPLKRLPQALATGTISIQHPAGDPKLAQTELNAHSEKMQLAKPKVQGVAAPKTDLAAQKQAAAQKQQASRQSQLLDQIRPKVPAEAYQKLAQRLAAAAAPQVVKGAAASPAPPPPPAGGTPNNPATAATKTPRAATSGPVITALSVAAGQPGDPVLITGSGFSATAGEVHFLLGSGNDIKGVVSGWNDNQILTTVPDASGLPGFNGQVFVHQGTANSPMVPFRFNPALEYRTLTIAGDRDIRQPYYAPSLTQLGVVDHDASGSFAGAKGDDQYYLATRLRNGWVVDSAYLTGMGDPQIFRFGNADAAITEVRTETDSPYLKIHWWMEWFSGVAYTPHVVIRGPRGVPHF
jgi:hypothetical protein